MHPTWHLRLLGIETDQAGLRIIAGCNQPPVYPPTPAVRVLLTCWRSLAAHVRPARPRKLRRPGATASVLGDALVIAGRRISTGPRRAC